MSAKSLRRILNNSKPNKLKSLKVAKSKDDDGGVVGLMVVLLLVM